MSTNEEGPNASLVERVKKLLALAGNNPNPEEAESAMLKAQAMMAKHGLAHGDLEDRARDVFRAVVGSGDSPPPRWIQKLASVVAKNFRCVALVVEYEGRPVQQQSLLGLAEDVEIAFHVFNSAAATAKAAASAYIISKIDTQRSRNSWFVDISTSSASAGTPFFTSVPNPRRTAGLKNDFLLGWVEGIERKFSEQVRSTGTALVVSAPKEVKDVVDNLEIRDAQTPREEFAGSMAAQVAGLMAGHEFSYAEPTKAQDTTEEIEARGNDDEPHDG